MPLRRLGCRPCGNCKSATPHPREATDAQVTLIVINCCIVQLIPTTLINLRIAAGSAAPMAIVWPSILATFGTTVVGVVLCLWVHRKR